MKIVNIHEAKTQLSRLIEAVTQGESVIIAKAGKPVAKLIRIESNPEPQRLGFLQGRGHVPDDFNDIETDSIASLFEGPHQ